MLEQVIKERLREFEQRVVRTSDQRACAWLFTGGPPLPAEHGTRVFSADNSPIRVHFLDLYHGRHPTLCNLATLKYGHQPRFALKRIAVLDSNAASYARDFLTGRMPNPAARETIAALIKFIIREGIDVSAVFYLLESLARSDSERWRVHALGFAEAVADIQTLDRDLFLNKGLLAGSLAARAAHLAFHGVQDSAALTAKYADAVPLAVVHTEADKLDLSYAALLKISLLRSGSTGISDRLIKLGTFMASELGAVLGFERYIALAHWAAPERYASLITPMQRGVRVDKLLAKLRSTAWDIYLGRLPEQLGRFLVSSRPDDADAALNLYYVVTAEDALAEIVGERSIELLVQYSDSVESKLVVGHRSKVIEKLLPAADVAEVARTVALWDAEVSRTAHLRERLARPKLQALITQLEAEVAAEAV
jgi:hypothetical protein